MKRKNMNWTQAKKRYPALSPYGDSDFDGLVNCRDCKPFDTSKDGIFGRLVGKATGDKYGQSAADYKAEKGLKRDVRKAQKGIRAEKRIARAKGEDIEDQKKRAIIAKEKAKRAKFVKGRARKARATTWKTTKKVGTATKKFVKGQKALMKAKYIKSLKPVKIKRRPMPPQLQRAQIRRKLAQQPRRVVAPPRKVVVKAPTGLPSTVRELQEMKKIRQFLTKEEQASIDRIMPAAQRPAAIQMISRRINARQLVENRIRQQRSRIL